jgi:hypothetical protein
MSKRQQLMINRTDPPLAKGVCDPKGRRSEPILGLASLKAEWERRKELRGCLKSPDSVIFTDYVPPFQPPSSWDKP